MAFDNIVLDLYVYSGESVDYGSSDLKYTLNKFLGIMLEYIQTDEQ